MKKSFSVIIIMVVLFSLSFSAHQESGHFYYYSGEKVFLPQATDKIILKFAPDAGREQLLAIVGSDASLQETSKCYLDEGSPLRIAVLEAKDGKRIAMSTLESFKAKTEFSLIK